MNIHWMYILYWVYINDYIIWIYVSHHMTKKILFRNNVKNFLSVSAHQRKQTIKFILLLGLVWNLILFICVGIASCIKEIHHIYSNGTANQNTTALRDYPNLLRKPRLRQAVSSGERLWYEFGLKKKVLLFAMLLKYFTFLFLISTIALAEEKDVVELTDDSFKHEINQLENTLVMFYAPW